MLKVDTKKIREETLFLDSYIKDYMENSNDIYNELSKLSTYWKDNASDLFNQKIFKQKENELYVIENLEKFNNIYKMIDDIYSNIK